MISDTPQGRVHVYEGIPLWKIAIPVRVMRMLGVRKVAQSFMFLSKGGVSTMNIIDFFN